MSKITVILYAIPILLGIFGIIYILSRMQMRGWLDEIDKFLMNDFKTKQKEDERQEKK